MTNEEIEAMRAENERLLAIEKRLAKLEAKGPDPPKPTAPMKPWEPPWAGIGYDNYIMDQIAKVPNSQSRDMAKLGGASRDDRDRMREGPALPTVRVIC